MSIGTDRSESWRDTDELRARIAALEASLKESQAGFDGLLAHNQEMVAAILEAERQRDEARKDAEIRAQGIVDELFSQAQEGMPGSPWATEQQYVIDLRNWAVTRIAKFKRDADYFLYLTSDPDDPAQRARKNDLLQRLPTMSYSAAKAAIDAAIKESGNGK